MKKKVKTKNKIYFVRHAETFTNTFEKFEHPAHIRLTPKGHQESKALVKKIKSPAKIFVSKYFRTLQTAGPLIEKYKDVEVQVLPHIHEFTYLNPDSFVKKGLTKEGKSELVMKFWDRLDPNYRDGDIAESFSDFLKRIDKTVEQVKKIKSKGDIYIFSHSMFMKTMIFLSRNKRGNLKKFMKSFYDMQFDMEKKIIIENCEIIDMTDIIKNHGKNK